MHKIVKIAAVVLSLLGILFFVLLSVNSDAEDNSWITPMIYTGYIAIIACVVLVAVFVLKNLFTHPAQLKRALIVIGIFLGVLLLSYIMADDSEVNANGIVYSGSTTKWVGTGIFAFYILGLVAIGAMVWTGFNKLIKK